jgi:hypothetical protein
MTRALPAREKDPIHGSTMVFAFDDGPMAGKSFEHRFTDDGHVTFGPPGGNGTTVDGYQVSKIRDDVWLVTYKAQYVLTTVLDFATGTLTSVASNDKDVIVQHGRIETRRRAA